MNNSDILFLYDAKLTNPNGDIDEENRPRMDYERSINLVSDVRLKRYIRDYFEQIGKEIFVGKVDGETVNATERIKRLFEKYDGKVNINKLSKEQQTWMLDQLIDVRVFGATMPLKSEDKGSSMTFIGPVQFNWGYSLNKVTLVESASITSHFGSDDKNDGGNIGKDYRVYYSFLAFHGVISGHRAAHTRLTDEDIRLFDKAVIKSIPLSATRSKVGQYPRLYVRVEYNSPEFLVGDLRDLVSLAETEGLRSISEVQLHVDVLVNKLLEVRDEIAYIHYWQDSNLLLSYEGLQGKLVDLIPTELADKLVSVL
ncbi:CRISPR-associated protein Csh2 [Anoxybacillus flavithermus NBRC 109594]|uniref:CRISPR-associated protein Csh2 n=1 Tax=Anoxybacillus flavithermus NBRC 109594 TaxID=1315967 RepID=R4G6G3_9BACL|nr:type I-B CRISPR-associated protein Cas7/Csh2 [Anoxybacillus flavithermus]GAC90882.1 CRISPR-associated protein Csh2 [Anoxybacillus flavithermus NBRC 109594]